LLGFSPKSHALSKKIRQKSGTIHHAMNGAADSDLINHGMMITQ